AIFSSYFTQLLLIEFSERIKRKFFASSIPVSIFWLNKSPASISHMSNQIFSFSKLFASCKTRALSLLECDIKVFLFIYYVLIKYNLRYIYRILPQTTFRFPVKALIFININAGFRFISFVWLIVVLFQSSYHSLLPSLA